MPFFLSSFARFRKKLTVIGIIGQMQGIATANSPPTKPISRMYHSEWFAMLSPLPIARSSEMTGRQREADAPPSSPEGDTNAETCAVSVTFSLFFTVSGTTSCALFSSTFAVVSPSGDERGAFPLAFSAASLGGRHISSLHAPHSRYASMSYCGLVNFTFCTNCTEFSKYRSFIPNISSNCEISLPFGVSLPTSSAPSILFTCSDASIGPSCPRFVE